MRGLADRQRIERLLAALGRAADADTSIYLVGGTTAVLLGWRESTVDVDFAMRPENDALLRAIPALKETLHINVELASPVDFLPIPQGWESRSQFVSRVEHVRFYHFDLYAQALAKVERGHTRDLNDVREMLRRELIDPQRARDYFTEMEPFLYRFPAIHAPTFRRAVEEIFVI